MVRIDIQLHGMSVREEALVVSVHPINGRLDEINIVNQWRPSGETVSVPHGMYAVGQSGNFDLPSRQSVIPPHH